MQYGVVKGLIVDSCHRLEEQIAGQWVCIDLIPPYELEDFRKKGIDII
jgi:hypothetical protein